MLVKGPQLLVDPSFMYTDVNVLMEYALPPVINIYYDDAIKWKHFPHYWPLVRGIHGALMFSLICVWINGGAHNRNACNLRRHRAHGPHTRYLKLRVAYAPGMPGTFCPPPTSIPVCITTRTQRTCRDACRDHQTALAGKMFPEFLAHAQPAILRIWQDAYCEVTVVIISHVSNFFEMQESAT